MESAHQILIEIGSRNIAKSLASVDSNRQSIAHRRRWEFKGLKVFAEIIFVQFITILKIEDEPHCYSGKLR